MISVWVRCLYTSIKLSYYFRLQNSFNIADRFVSLSHNSRQGFDALICQFIINL